MHPDLQSTYKPDGLHQSKVSHRSLNEEVLQSAVDVAKGEVSLADDSSLRHKLTHHHAGEHEKHADAGLMQRFEDKVTRFVLLQPMKASMMAAGAGVILTLLLEQGLKRLIKPKP